MNIIYNYVINVYYNYYICNKGLFEACDKQQNMAVTGLLLIPVQKQIVKRSAQCHVLVQSPPSRRPNDKYPVNTSHRSDLCKNVSLLCCLVTTVIHIRSVYSHICGCTHMFFTIWRRWLGKKNINYWNRSECRVPRKSFLLAFWTRLS